MQAKYIAATPCYNSAQRDCSGIIIQFIWGLL